MTLNTTYKPAVAQGNGIIKEFSYSFNPLSLSYIKVYFEIDGKWVEQKTGWSATVSDSGGVVTFLTAPTTRVSIERDIPESQPTSYTTSSGFQAKVIENSFDLLTGMVQELKDASDRSVKVEVGDNQTPEELLEEVYNKLDSAIEIAGDAINAANQAQTAADNATNAVNSAEQTLVETQEYVTQAKADIEDTKNTAISTIDDTVLNAKGEIANTIVSAKADITNTADNATGEITSTVAQAKSDINTAVSNAESNISTIVSDAEGSITNIAVTEANKAIANAAQEATNTATENVNSYVNTTILPPLQNYVNSAQSDANSAATSMEQAALSAKAASEYASNASADADNAAESAGLAANGAIWAEGTDEEVQALGGVHSSKGWSEIAQAVVDGKQDIANLSQTIDDSTEKYPSNAAVKAAIDAKDSLPAQSGQSGKFLTTDGTTASWGTVDVSGAINTHNTDLNAHSNKFKAVSILPSSKYIDLTLGASGSTYTAPANGWFTLNFTSSGTNGFIVMYARLSASATANSGRYGITASIPVVKGENMILFYGNGSADMFRFYYAEGEN